MQKKLFIVMPAYNAALKITSVFERIPSEIWQKNPNVIIVNDGSTDKTAEKIQEIQNRWPNIQVLNKIKNEGYARAQKDGFTKALGEGAEIVVLLHADGQYPPEIMSDLLKPLEDGQAEIVQGSRMIDKKSALKGGMPLYKFFANIFLSTLENWTYGLHFSEYHSGYMLYSLRTLQTIPYLKLSNTFHFDGEMLFVGAKKGLRVVELPIPTTYADEISHVKPISYGFHVLGIMLKYLLGKYNF
ncbi:MAG: glycosyltransferase family 2 protein [Patescibacteria group bacterium]